MTPGQTTKDRALVAHFLLSLEPVPTPILSREEEAQLVRARKLEQIFAD